MGMQKYSVGVRTVDASGAVDPTPAVFSFKVRRPNRRARGLAVPADSVDKCRLAWSSEATSLPKSGRSAFYAESKKTGSWV
jgi:hypothetical protein